MENKFANYKGLTIGKNENVEVSEEEIKTELDQLIESKKESVAKEGLSEVGDIVNIDFEGFVDNIPFQGGKGEKYDLTLGSNTFIPGFEDQLVGYKSGDEVEVKVTFPQEYHAENLKGKDAIFKCKINEVKSTITPIANDEFAHQLGFKTLLELKEAISQEIKNKKANENQRQYITELCDEIIKNSEIVVEKDKLDARIEEIVEYYKQLLSQYGNTLESYLKMSNMTEEQFKFTLTPEAEKSVKIDLIYEHIAAVEGLVATEEDINKELDFLREYYHPTEEQLAKFRADKIDEIVSNIVRGKVTEILINSNN